MTRIDEHFADLRLAELYDAWHDPATRDDYAFYLPMAMQAESVLDIGCGTGSFLGLLRDAGHRGRLCGVDPANGMMTVARRRTDIAWVHGLPGGLPADDTFDFILMTGHAFQAIVEDDEILATFAAVRRLLAPGGRFAFETRNPSARTWERWVPENAVEVPDGDGGVLRMEHHVQLPVSGELVHFETRYFSPRWEGVLMSGSTLRFLDAPRLNAMLSEAGLSVDSQWGDFDRTPLTASSPEIVTLALRR